MKKIIKYILSVGKTIYLNFKVFNFNIAYKFPIFVSYDTKILEIHKNSIKINCSNIKTAMIKIGFGGTEFIHADKSYIKIQKNAEISFKGKAFLSEGSNIFISNNANIEYGDNFSCNKNCLFYVNKRLTFGDNDLIGWNVNFRDNDGHIVIENNIEKENSKEIDIEDNVWIGSYVDVLKGVTIKNNSVVATRSVVTKKIEKSGVLIGGYPAKVIKENIKWRK